MGTGDDVGSNQAVTDALTGISAGTHCCIHRTCFAAHHHGDVAAARRAVEAAGLATAFAAGDWAAAAGRALGAAAGGVELAAAAAATDVELAAAAAGAGLAAAAPLVVDLGVGVAMAQKYGGWSDDRSIGQLATRAS